MMKNCFSSFHSLAGINKTVVLQKALRAKSTKVGLYHATGLTATQNPEVYSYFSKNQVSNVMGDSSQVGEQLPIFVDDFQSNKICQLTESPITGCPYGCSLIPIQKDLSLNIREKNDGFEVEFYSPDLTNDKVKLAIKNNFLIMSIKDKQSCGNQIFGLPSKSIGMNIKAFVKDGHLKISIPKRQGDFKNFHYGYLNN